MAQPTAPVKISVVVQVLGRDFTQNPATTVEKEESLTLSTTVANYATDLTAFGTQVWNRYQSLLTQAGSGSGLTAIQGQIVIDNVTGAQTPATPYYSTFEGFATPPVAVAFPQQLQHHRANFQIGQYDFTDAATLATVMTTPVTKFIQVVGY